MTEYNNPNPQSQPDPSAVAPPDLSAVAEKMKTLLQRIGQAKNNPAEVERAVAEGQKQLEALTKNKAI